MVLVCEEGVWLRWCYWGIFNRENYYKKRNGLVGYERVKMKITNVIHICVRMCICIYIYIYMCVCVCVCVCVWW